VYIYIYIYIYINIYIYIYIHTYIYIYSDDAPVSELTAVSDMAQLYVWHDTFTLETCLIHMCDMTHLLQCALKRAHQSVIWVTTRYMSHDSLCESHTSHGLHRLTTTASSYASYTTYMNYELDERLNAAFPYASRTTYMNLSSIPIWHTQNVCPLKNGEIALQMPRIDLLPCH